MTTQEQCKVAAADASTMPLGPWAAAPDRGIIHNVIMDQCRIMQHLN